MPARLSRGYPGAGFVAGATAVVLNQGGNYVLVPWICANRVNLVPLLSLGFAGVALFGAFLSWRALSPQRQGDSETHAGGRPYDLLAGVGICFAFLCVGVVLMQGAAGLVFNGCER